MASLKKISFVALPLVWSIGIFTTDGKSPTSATEGISSTPSALTGDKITPSLLAMGDRNTAKPRPSVWRTLSSRVANQTGRSAGELAQAYHEAQTLITDNESESVQEFRNDLPRLLETASLRESYFAVSAFTRSLSRPTQVLESLWDVRPKILRSSEPQTDPHHEPVTALSVHRRLEAYAAKELRRRIASGHELSGDERAALLDQAVTRAGSERSLDVSLELFELLQTLGAHREIEVTLSRRLPDERQLIEAHLAGRRG